MSPRGSRMVIVEDIPCYKMYDNVINVAQRDKAKHTLHIMDIQPAQRDGPNSNEKHANTPRGEHNDKHPTNKRRDANHQPTTHTTPPHNKKQAEKTHPQKP